MDTRSKLILIADDYDNAAEIIAALIETITQHRTVTAKDGLDALAIAEEQGPDVCLLDIEMPLMGGMETARLLRVMFGERRPFMIGMTGGVGLFDAVQSELFDEVMIKPLNTRKLVRLIDRL